MATANQLQNMSGPLLDRLEIIQLSGYTLEEKRHIAQVSAIHATCKFGVLVVCIYSHQP